MHTIAGVSDANAHRGPPLRWEALHFPLPTTHNAVCHRRAGAAHDSGRDKHAAPNQTG